MVSFYLTLSNQLCSNSAQSYPTVGLCTVLHSREICQLECFSKEKTNQVVNDLTEDYLDPILEKKRSVEEMWRKCGSKRSRRTVACQGARGFSIFADNVGFQSTARNNTGLHNKNQYVSMAQAVVVENRVASSHLRYF